MRNFSQVISNNDFINNNISELEDIINDLKIYIDLSKNDNNSSEKVESNENVQKKSGPKKDYKKEISDKDKEYKERRSEWVQSINDKYTNILHDRFKSEDEFSIDLSIDDFSNLDFGEVYGFTSNKNPGKGYRWDTNPKQSIIWYLLHSRYNIEDFSKKRFFFNVNNYEKDASIITVAISTESFIINSKQFQKKCENASGVTPNDIIEATNNIATINENGETMMKSGEVL